MNRKTTYLNILAATLMLGAGTTQAAAHTLEDAIRLQARDASAAIQAQTRANLRTQPLVVDVPGVEIGEIKLVRTERAENTRTLSTHTTAAGISDTLRRDLVMRALEAPGMFSVYRAMAATALKAAIIVAE